jgi:glyoxylate reductase
MAAERLAARDLPRVVLVGDLADEAAAAELARSVSVTRVTAAELAVPRARDAAPTDHLRTARGLLVVGQAPVTEEFLAATPALRVVAVRAVGCDRVDVASCTRRRVAVCNTPGAMDASVAEVTVLLMLATARKLASQLVGPHRRSYAIFSADALGLELAGRQLGIVGLGRIGRRVARLAAGFGMSLVHCGGAATDEVASRAVGLDELLATSDVVSLHAPLTDGTRHMISTAQLARMKPSAILINTARGALVDELSLCRALNDRTIWGAGLDVTVREPLAADDPLLDAPNLVLTPHIGSATTAARHRMNLMAVRNLVAVLAGTRPPSCINPEVLA